MTKKKPVKKTGDTLEKFASYFEMQNSKEPAKKIMWLGVLVIGAGIIAFVAYAAKLQIGSFAWDNATVKIKNDAQEQWSNYFNKEEKEKNINDIKKQMTNMFQQIASSTASTSANVSTTIITTTSTITNTATVSSTINKIKK